MREPILRDRRIRESLMARGGQPYGDKAVNPRAKTTAYDYYRWMKRASSTSVHAGAYLGNLEREEHLLGENSYPEGHPRHQHLAQGQFYPAGTPRPMRLPEPPSRSSELQQSARRAFEESVRPNVVKATCANCGKSVEPGEGQITRRTNGYAVIHKNEDDPQRREGF